VIRGVNLFPSAVEQVVRSFPGVTAEYLIVIDPSVMDSHGFLTGIRLRVERVDASVPGDTAQRLEQEIRARLQIRAQVDVLDAGALPRSTHKARRVVREGLSS
jgi:phenylacetate-CoA ligase